MSLPVMMGVIFLHLLHHRAEQHQDAKMVLEAVGCTVFEDRLQGCGWIADAFANSNYFGAVRLPLETCVFIDKSEFQHFDQLFRLHNLTRVCFSREQIPDASFRVICRLSGITTIAFLPGSGVSQKALQYLTECKQLRTLFLDQGIGEIDLKSFPELPNLRLLHVTNTNLNCKALAHLCKFPRVEVLYLDDCRIDERGIVNLNALLCLRRLSVVGTNLSDIGLRELARLERIEYIDISQTDVTSRGLVVIEKMSSLRAIDVDPKLITQCLIVAMKARRPDILMNGVLVSDWEANRD